MGSKSFSVTALGMSCSDFLTSNSPTEHEVSDFLARLRNDIGEKRSPLLGFEQLEDSDLHPWFRIARWCGWWSCRQDWDKSDQPIWEPRPVEVSQHPSTRELSEFLDNFVERELPKLCSGFIRCGRRWAHPSVIHAANAPLVGEASRCWRALAIGLSLGLTPRMAASAAAACINHPWLVLLLASIRDQPSEISLADHLQSGFRKFSLERIREAGEVASASDDSINLSEWYLPNYLGYFQHAIARIRMGEAAQAISGQLIELVDDSNESRIWESAVERFLTGFASCFRSGNRVSILQYLECAMSDTLLTSLRTEFAAVISEIRSGGTLSEALRIVDGVLSHPLLVCAVQALESGQLEAIDVLLY